MGTESSLEFSTNLGAFRVPSRLKKDTMVRSIAAGKLHDWRVAEAVIRYHEPFTDVLDVGANLGQMSVCIGRGLHRKQSRDESVAQSAVIAIEAQQELADYASQNFILNGTIGRVIQTVLWSENDALVPFPVSDLVKYESAGSYGVDFSSDGSPQLRTQTLDSLDLPTRVSVAKFDIQGSELEAFRGAKGLFENHRPAVIFEFEESFAIELGYVFHDYIDFLTSMNYRIVEFIGSNDFLAVPEDFVASHRDWDSHRRRTEESQFMELISV